jgi:hypothetical protein
MVLIGCLVAEFLSHSVPMPTLFVVQVESGRRLTLGLVGWTFGLSESTHTDGWSRFGNWNGEYR